MPPTRALIDAASAHPNRVFWAFALLHLILWTAAPTLVSPNAPLDVIEGYVWGHEWLLGTYKHPPMQAWWLETLTLITGQATWTHFLACQIAIVIAFYAVWRLGRRLTDERGALISVFLLEGVVYYNFTSPEFNPNVLQLPFWALIGLFYHRAVKDDRLSDWLWLAFWAACGLYSKYSTILLLTVLAALLIIHRDARQRLKSKGPYLAAAFLALLCAPHVMWLIENDFTPFTYMTSRMHDAAAQSEYAARPLRFFISQTLVILPMMILLVALAGGVPVRRRQTGHALSFDQYFLTAVTFAPFVFLLLAAILGMRVHDMWGTPLWGYASLWSISFFDFSYSPRSQRRAAYCWLAAFSIPLALYIAVTIYYPYLTHKAMRVYFPGQELSQQVSDGWTKRVGKPLQYVIGDTWPAGNVAYYPPGRQHVLINGDYSISPWINASDLRQKGAVLVWCIKNCASHNFTEAPPLFLKDYPSAEIQKELVLPRQTKADLPPVTIGWAILPPLANN